MSIWPLSGRQRAADQPVPQADAIAEHRIVEVETRRVERRVFALPPILLDAPPGIGKSHWARHLRALLSVPAMVLEAITENAPFCLVGSQRAWGNSVPGRLINTIRQHRVGNPVVVVYEVEKVGRAISTKGQSFNLAESLFSLLEPTRASAWICPFYEVKFDMGWVDPGADLEQLSVVAEPLPSRCPPIRLRELTLEDLTGFVRLGGARCALPMWPSKRSPRR